MSIKKELMKLSKGEIVGKLIFAYETIYNMEQKIAANNNSVPKCSVLGCNANSTQFFCNKHLGVIGLNDAST